MNSVHCGYEESRKEQARLHEEFAQREKKLRDARIPNIHEVGELKRAQEMRIDEFSFQKLRKSSDDTGAHFTDTGVAGKNESNE